MLFSFLEVGSFGIFTSLLEQSDSMGKGQLRKNKISFLILHQSEEEKVYLLTLNNPG